MKNIYGIFKYSVAVFFTAFICICQTVQAGYGFFEDGTGDLSYYVKYNDDTVGEYFVCNESGCSRKNHYTKDVGEDTKLFVKDLYLKQWFVKTFKDGNGDVCNAKLLYFIEGVTGTYEYGYNYCTGISGGQQWGANGSSGMDINVLDLVSGTPGIYNLNFYYKINAGNGGCGDNWVFSNTGANWNTLRFGVAGFKGDEIDFGNVLQDIEQTEADYSFNSFGWATCSASITGDDASAFSFVSGDYTDAARIKSSIAINNDVSESFNIYFKATSAASYSAKLHLSGTIKEGNKDIRTIEADIPITGVGQSGNIVVMLPKAAEPQNGLKAKLFGYLKSTGCNPITKYGFKWGTTSYPIDDQSYSSYTYDNTEDLGTLSADDGAGTEFEKLLENLTKGQTYYYRVFAENSNNTSKNTVSAEGSFTVESECIYPDPVNDMIYVTINNNVTPQPCNLIFESISDALDAIKNHDPYYDDTNHKLRTNVIMTVINTGKTYTEETTAGKTGGYATDAKSIKIESFNYGNPDKTLYLRGESRTSRATLQHLIIRNSKSISIENLMITGYKDPYGSYHDNAIDIDNNDDDWTNQDVGAVSSANINFKNCYIKSYGFACLHISAYDGVTIEDCDIDADYKDEKNTDATQWGSSIKLIHSKNIKLLRNNFRGSHSTSTWIQGCTNVLLMNNVYWNKNVVTTNVAFVRLVCQTTAKKKESVSNIGIYYNTFYLAAGSSTTPRKADFFRLGSWYNGDSKQTELGASTVTAYDASTIEFKYNNCYSYDEYVSGRNLDAAKTGGKDDSDGYPFLTADKLSEFCGNINYNNFWSKYDKKWNEEHPSEKITQSNFAITPSGCSPATTTKFINVEAAVCATESSDPSSLVVKTNALNLGGSIKNDVSNQGANNIYTDRLHSTPVRPKTSSGGGESSATSGTENGSILLSVNSNVATSSKDIDVTGFGLTANSTVSCTLSGTNADKFSLSHSSLTVGSTGTLSTMVVTVTFEKPVSTGTYYAVVNFTSDNADGPRTVGINVTGKYDSDTPIANGWTLGAYQMSHGDKVSTIIWNGGTSTDWDNRNNWVKTDGTRVTCVDLLDENLRVIIPAPTRYQNDDYPRPEGGITSYPILPSNFNSRASSYGDEVINAGQGLDGVVPTHFASAIELQYGGSIKGVESLFKDGVRRYEEATANFTAKRSVWLIVGSVVKPFKDGKKSEVRNIKSRDYYLYTMPHVYMHKATIKESNAAWDKSFASLDVDVLPETVYAIRVPNEYGPYKVPASIYKEYVDSSLDDDGTKAVPFASFNGWFQNEGSLPSYSGLSTSGSWVSNTYPANLDIAKLLNKEENKSASVTVYDYDDWNFTPASEGEVLSQSGFLVSGVEELKIDQDMFTGGNTQYRNAVASVPTITLRISNETSSGGCKVTISYDELKTDVYQSGADNVKIFNTTSGYDGVPDLYILRYAKRLSALSIPTLNEPIPLGVKLKSNMTLKFANFNSSNFSKAVLIDKVAGVETNLLSDTYVVKLDKGEYDDRFFLNLSVLEDIPTSAREVDDVNAEDNILISNTSDGQVVISSTNGVILKDVYITDMAGRTWHKALKNDHYNELRLNSSDGVYVIKVVGDKMNKTEKLILK